MTTKLKELRSKNLAALRNYEVLSAALKSDTAVAEASSLAVKEAGITLGNSRLAIDDYKSEAGLGNLADIESYLNERDAR